MVSWHDEPKPATDPDELEQASTTLERLLAWQAADDAADPYEPTHDADGW